MPNPVAEALPDDSPAEAERSLTRAEFCKLENFSLSTYHKIQNLGCGPDEVRIPGLALVRITAEARRKWHEKMEKLTKADAANIEAQRRSTLASMAGRAAAASPLHYSKRKHKAEVKTGRRSKAEAR